MALTPYEDPEAVLSAVIISYFEEEKKKDEIVRAYHVNAVWCE